ncbi:MAG TPA: VTT domain-containing protein [Candidatus Paceibacterota bacterium]|nr:VTT domain-containing protein [Candidatus Paceibacterota bacterium]
MTLFLSNILNIPQSHPILLSFFAPIFTGEPGVIFLAFLGATGEFSLLTVAIWSFLGMTTVDSLWFFFPKTKIYQRLIGHRYVSKPYRKIEEQLRIIAHDRDILILLLSKILIGTRVLILVFVGTRRLTFWRFLPANAAANAIWISVLMLVGFLARGGFEQALKTFQNIQIAAALIVALALLLYYGMKRINQWLLEK